MINKKSLWKYIMLTFAAVGILLNMAGCGSLANPELDYAALEERDRLVGVYVTEEHLDLFDMESYLNDHMGDLISGGDITVSNGESHAYMNRVYAQVTEGEDGCYDYSFPEIEGMLLMVCEEDRDYGKCTVISGDDAFSDVVSAAGDHMVLEGTIYVAGEHVMFFMNPVYQTADGEIYLTAGTGLSGDMPDGASMSQSMKEEWTETADKETVEKSSEITVTIAGKKPSEYFSIAWLDSENQLLEQKEYSASDAEPSVIPYVDGAAYMICTSWSGADPDRAVLRQIVNAGEPEEHFQIYIDGGDGIVYCRELYPEDRAGGEK